MSDFTIAAALTLGTTTSLGNEGGYGNDTNDLGGETKYGISKRSYPHLDIRNLTLEKAYEIAKEDYWDRYRLSEIDNQLIANCVFDMIFNIDYTIAAVCIQNAINNLGGILLKRDGIIGSVTLETINTVPNPLWLLDKIKIERIKHYLGRVAANKSQLQNLEGWIRRAVK